MGSRKAEAYLGSPAVVAASALAGVICGPSYLHTADDDDAERQAAAAAQQQEEDQQQQQEEGEEEDRQARAADVDAAEASVKALGDQIRARKAAGAGKDDVAEAVGALLAAKEALRAAALAHVAALESADDVDAAALEAARAGVPPLSKAERKAQEQQQQQQPVEEGASLAELLFAPVELQEPEFAPYPPPSAPVPPSGAAAVVTSFAPGFQTKREGEMLFCHEDNLNTDGIFAGTHTYKENLTDEDMARLAMENYDPKFAAMARAGDLLVGGFNFGCGSSREQAATALRCAGIDVVLAGSFSETYKRNAFNNGLLCLESPALVGWLWDTYGAEWPTVRTGLRAALDFARSTATVEHVGAPLWPPKVFAVAPVGRVAQELVVAGSLEAWIVGQQREEAEER